MTKKQKIHTSSSKNEMKQRKYLFEQFRHCPIPSNEMLQNLGLFLNRQSLSRILFFHELYQKIINVHGVVMEFGVRWGQTLALFESFRGMYEPYNFTRKIIGFDTFSGFTSIHPKDGKDDVMVRGSYAVPRNYKNYLQKILNYHEQESPTSHLKKYRLVKGDASLTIKKYLKENPETIIALAYFDMDLYEPTKSCLQAIKNHLTKGSLIGFDELNRHEFPGETEALKEVLGLSKIRITRSTLMPSASYFVVE